MDGSFYLAVFGPMLRSSSLPVRMGLFLVLTAWYLWLSKNWNRRNMIETAREAAFLEAKLLAVIELFEFVLLRSSVWKRSCAPFVLSFIVSGILLLRAARLNRNSKKAGSFWMNSGWELLALLAAAFVVSSRPVSHGIYGLLANCYQLLLLPVIELFLFGMIRALSWLWPFLSSLFSRDNLEMPEASLEIGGVSAEMIFEGMERADPPKYLKTLGILLLGILLSAFFYYLFRKLSEGSRFSQKEIAGEISRNRMDPDRSEKEPYGSLWIREKNIRFYYREFLRLCLKHGVYQIKENGTTEKIGQRAKAKWGMEAELTELRRLYLKVRYGEKEEDAGEKRRMKEIYKMVKGKAAESSDRSP